MQSPLQSNNLLRYHRSKIPTNLRNLCFPQDILKLLLTTLVMLPLLHNLSVAQSTSKDTSFVEYLDSPWQTRFNFGFLGVAGINLHTADFKGLEGIKSCCPGYETGAGLNYGGAFFANIPLSGDLELSTRLGYLDLSGLISRKENTTILGGNATSGDGIFEHSIDGKISSANVQLLLSYRLNDELRLSTGLRVGSLLTKTYSQKEEILQPSNALYLENGRRVRNEFSGEIPNVNSLETAFLVAGSYDLPMNSENTLFLVPEVTLGYGFSSFIQNFAWNVLTINGGLGLRFAPRAIKPAKVVLPPPPPPPPPPLPPPPPPPDVPSLDATVLALSLDDNGKEQPVSTIKVEEFLMNRTHPLLPYIFFDENSNTIPSRYKVITQKEKDEFSFKNFYQVKTMDVYYNILNILGKRLQFYPQAMLTLVGCNADVGSEAGNKALSQRRAEVVKDFLVREWNIDTRRINIEYKNLPDIPSNVKEKDGIEENRRVEMTANIPQIFEPVQVKDTLRISNPPRFRFKPQIFTNIGVKSWKVVTSQLGKDLKVFSGEGNPPGTIDWDVTLESEQTYVPRLDQPLEYRLLVTDNDNKVLESPKQTLPVQQLTIEKKIDEVMDDKEISKYSIIGFGFNKSTLLGGNIDIANDAKKGVRKNSTISIKGYSDRIGNNDRNKALSLERAYSVADYLGTDRKFAKGIGEDVLLYDNELPEGRFYSRTVTIDVETPVE